MPQYRVRALDNLGDLHEVALIVSQPAQVAEELARRGLRPLTVKRRQPFMFLPDLLGRGGFEVDLFVHELSSLLKAGLSVAEAVALLAEKETSASQAQVLTRLVRHLREGDKLSRAFEREGSTFPPLLVAMTRASENTARLSAGFERYLHYDRTSRALKRKVTSAMIYPALLIAVAAAVTVFLATFVVPRFALLFEEGAREVPAVTAALLSLSTLLSQHGFALAAVLCALGISLIYAWRVGGAALIARSSDKLPIVGKRIHTARISRLLMAIAALLDAGVPLTQALDLAKSVLPRSLEHRISDARISLEQGFPLSQALLKVGLSTLVSERLLRVGERSGDLAGLAAQAARHHEEETERFLERFMRIAEPVLMAAIGLVIGAVVIALYMPLFDLAQWIR
jgi:general secretion pathway protein F